MSNIDFLLSRFSCGSLTQPAPNDDELHQILSTAMRAPDHGRLRPWRFVIIGKEYREKWVRSLEKILTKPDSRYPPAYITKIVQNFSNAPLILALGFRQFHDDKTSISLDEQLMAASAATMNILNAVHVLGFGAKWITGPIDVPEITELLGLKKPYRMIGFMFIGTPVEGSEAPPRVSVDDYVANWQGSAVNFKIDS